MTDHNDIEVTSDEEPGSEFTCQGGCGQQIYHPIGLLPGEDPVCYICRYIATLPPGLQDEMRFRLQGDR